METALGANMRLEFHSVKGIFISFFPTRILIDPASEMRIGYSPLMSHSRIGNQFTNIPRLDNSSFHQLPQGGGFDRKSIKKTYIYIYI